jgi:hypothetical protein
MQEDLQLRLFDVNFSFQIDEDLLVDADSMCICILHSILASNSDW